MKEIRKEFTRKLTLVFFTVAALFISCASNNTDTDIKAHIETKLKSAPDMSGAVVEVMNGIVTITGECKDEASKNICEKIAQDVAGVKTVINNLMVPAEPGEPRAAAIPDTAAATLIVAVADPLATSVADVAAKYPTVKAEVKDSIITLTGDIRKNELPVLIKTLSSLKPKKIEKKLNVVKNARTKTAKAKKAATKPVKRKKRSRRR